jgi:hypothetical protein
VVWVEWAPVRQATGNDACRSCSRAAIIVAVDWDQFRALFGLTLSGRWSRAIERLGST